MSAARPRRSAAQKATAAITNLADRDKSTPPRGRNRDQFMDRASSSASPDSQQMPVTVKALSSSKLRHSTAAEGKRASRGGTKRYVESESDDDDEEEEEDDDDDDDDDDDVDDDEEEEDVIQVGDAVADDDDDEDMDVDAEGEEDEDMDVDAEGEEDADGDVDMDISTPAIKVTKPEKLKPLPKGARKPTQPRRSAASTAAQAGLDEEDDEEDDDGDELSELESDAGEMDQTVMTVGADELGDDDAEGEEDIDLDAEGEEIEVAGENDEEDDEEGLGSREETPDLTKMTKRQQARFKDEGGEYMELSNEVQAKKTFTAEELSMRRAEMARRRRNLSEKRTEEVKMETINKLLKKQVRKEPKRAAGTANDDETPDNEVNGAPSANPMFVRWVSNKDGSLVSVPVEILEGPLGATFGGPPRDGAARPRKMVEEVS